MNEPSVGPQDSGSASVDEPFALFGAFLEAHAGDPTSADARTALAALLDAHPAHRDALQKLIEEFFGLEAGMPGPLDAASTAPSPSPATDRLWRVLLTTGRRGDRYRVIDELGRGGNGIVHRVWDDELQRHLAMKVMRHASADIARRGRFLREVQVTSRLGHPGIVPVHEIGLRGGVVYYTMPVVDGDELGDVFVQVAEGRNGWTLARAVEVLVKVCDTVRFAHDRGVVHRDLKPSNIMVGRYGEVLVLDWGLAHLVAQDSCGSAPSAPGREPDASDTTPELTQDGDVLGSPAYMSPEQANGAEHIDQRTDVYALGAVLYHLLAGHTPFGGPGQTPDSTTVLKLLRAGTPPLQLNPGYRRPAELVSICATAIATVPDRRYPSVVALANDLRSWLEGRAVGAHDTSPMTVLWKWVSRNRALSAVVALAVLFGATLTGLHWREKRAAEHQRAVLALHKILDEFQVLSSTEPPPNVGNATAWWVARARSLVEGGSDGNLGLAEYEQELAELAALASGTDPSREPVIDGEPLSRILQGKRDELLWRRRMLRQEPWLSDTEVSRQLATVDIPPGALDRNQLAFSWINPDRRRAFGREQAAVAVVRMAVAVAVGPYEKKRCLDTLATALCRIGRFEEAALEQEHAIEHAFAPQPERPGEPTVLEWIASSQANQRMQQRLKREFHADNNQRTGVLSDEIRALEGELPARCLKFRDAATDSRYTQILAIVLRLRKLRDCLTYAESARGAKDVADLWERAIAAIATDPRYGRIRIRPQLDLLPIGPDPESGLQEFVHVRTGFVPNRDQAGRLFVNASTALIFVLIPEHEGSLPLFLSKFEVTRSQWIRLQGRWQNNERDAASTMAVTNVSPRDFIATLAEFGSWLRLPTAAEWRRGALAGRLTVWLDKVSVNELLDADSFCRVRGTGSTYPVDVKPGNPYGLHETLGGVRECCSDWGVHDTAEECARVVNGWPAQEEIDLVAKVNPRPWSCVIDERKTGGDIGARIARTLFP
ncbi:MAG: protein kinase [Planctomycetes bacterium]|nr:protein kinase [Planctomycetota bacterium]